MIKVKGSLKDQTSEAATRTSRGHANREDKYEARIPEEINAYREQLPRGAGGRITRRGGV